MPPNPETQTLGRLGAGVALLLGSSLMAASTYEGSPEAQSVQLQATAQEAVQPRFINAGKFGVASICKVEISTSGFGCPEISTTTLPPSPTSATAELTQELSNRQPKPRADRQKTASTPTVPPVPVEPAPAPETPAIVLTGTKVDWMNEAEIAPEDHGYVDEIVVPESGWDPAIISPKNCIGLGQNCEYKGRYWLKEACPDWATNPVCQLRRFTVYAIGRYGSWRQAAEYRRIYHTW